jgi:hypothetical protein
MAQSFKDTLKGVAELSIFMPASVNRFAGDKQSAIRSFAFPLLFYPFVLAGFSQRNDVTDVPSLLLHAAVCWLGLFMFFYLVWLALKNTEREQRFWLFVNVFNCQTLISMVLFAVGVYGYNVIGGPFEQYWLFYIFSELAFTTFIVTHTLRFPWTLGAFVATINLFINDIGFRLIMAGHEGLVA